MRKTSTESIKVPHPYAWLWEPLEDDPTFELRSMFGSKAAYLDGKMMVHFCAKTEPWHGLLLPTDREHHSSLMKNFPALKPHSVLGKWLYLSDSAEDFDRIAEKIVRLAAKRDPRLGVDPPPKKKRRGKTTAK